MVFDPTFIKAFSVLCGISMGEGVKIKELLKKLKSIAGPESVKGMAWFGINP